MLDRFCSRACWSIVVEAVFCPFFCSGLTIACLVSILDFGDLEQGAISSHFASIPATFSRLLISLAKLVFKPEAKQGGTRQLFPASP